MNVPGGALICVNEFFHFIVSADLGDVYVILADQLLLQRTEVLIAIEVVGGSKVSFRAFFNAHL